MIYDKRNATQILGCLFQNPSLFSNTDNYLFTPDDFAERLHKIIFSAIYNMFYNGVECININEFNNYLKNYPELFNYFNENKGNDTILTAIEICELENFKYYYERLKKLSLLRSLKNEGFNISDWYEEGLYDISKRQELEQKLERGTVGDIINSIQAKIFNIESTFINKKNFTFGSAADDLQELKEKLKIKPELGLPLQGDIFNTITRGARRAKVSMLSAGTGIGKTRIAIGNACKLAFPIRWSLQKEKWVNTGSCQKIMFVTTELEKSEVQTLILAYLTNINEEDILNGTYSVKYNIRLNQAIQIVQYYKENFIIYHLPDPTITQLNNNIRRLVITKQIDAVFYDYIHSSPQLLMEFSGMKVREDVVLLMMSTALKNLANELNIFIWTGTQVNANEIDIDFADESCIRGSRAIADKIDLGCILRLAKPQFLKTIKAILETGRPRPNMFIDIYKNRRSRYKRVRLWLDIDLGTCRLEDLFLTDEYGTLLPIDVIYCIDENSKISFEKTLEYLNKLPEEIKEKESTSLQITL